ncbi:hypothetical protein SAMN05421807_11646 [Virgibacillus chiguensis]|uniref:Uncharacterized protein n=1 Tax=Virgibacillus chiguensis TaxID=411959 RepID=A0A1M5WH97_9BACI|nr:hypothetical protein SAMN05421807_11646 [Virgibacillus chiguensis]
MVAVDKDLVTVFRKLVDAKIITCNWFMLFIQGIIA